MFDSINRMDGTSIDWSQLSTTKNTAAKENQLALSSTNVQFGQGSRESHVVKNQEKIYKELEKVNKQFQSLNHSMRMKFDEDADQFYVEVVDRKTSEVLESIPAKHVLELAAKLKEMVGFFIDEKR